MPPRSANEHGQDCSALVTRRCILSITLIAFFSVAVLPFGLVRHLSTETGPDAAPFRIVDALGEFVVNNRSSSFSIADEVVGVFDERGVAKLQSQRDRALEKENSLWVQSDDLAQYEQYTKEQSQRTSNNYEMELLGIPAKQREQNDIDSEYFAFDDDIVRTSGEESYAKGCRRTAVDRYHQRNCNAFHEYGMLSKLLDQSTRYLSSGGYRDAFVISATPLNDDNVMGAVFKILGLGVTNGYESMMLENLELSRIDATVQALLSASPRISDVYGYCGMSLFTELVPTEVERTVIFEEYDSGDYHLDVNEEDPPSKNNYSVAEKLQLALEYAQSIADLHYSEHGVIMHVDIKPDQFKRGVDGVLKLIDFNRAEILLFDEDKKTYCVQDEGGTGNIYRAPEELQGEAFDERADVYNYGINIVYSILTGLWRYSGEDEKQIRNDLVQGNMPPYNQHYAKKSYGYAVLQRILDECLLYNPSDRPEMSWVVDFLEKAIERNKLVEENEVGEEEWQKYPEVASLFV